SLKQHDRRANARTKRRTAGRVPLHRKDPAPRRAIPHHHPHRLTRPERVFYCKEPYARPHPHRRDSHPRTTRQNHRLPHCLRTQQTRKEEHMSRRRDLFARISLDYADHPKIAALTDAAFRAHIEMILYSRRYMTDGQIAKQIAKRWPEQALSELLSNDPDTPSLTLDESGNYHLHGFNEMQETRE